MDECDISDLCLDLLVMYKYFSLYSLRFGKRRHFGQDLSQTLGI
jgi:hypothetical protein